MDSQNWLKKLVAIDTTSRNSNLALIHLISACFADHKISSSLIYNTDKQKANLFATLPSAKGNTNNGLLLSAHTDTVPVDGQDWNTDPFQATLIDDKIYGRGTCDMKGFIAVVLALLPELIKKKLTKPLHFAFTFDEEVGCTGAPLLIKYLEQNNIQPSACIVGEPTMMRPIVGHKEINGFRCRVHGNAAHSSLTPQGCNAIEHAAELIHWIRNLADDLRSKGKQDKYYDVPFSTLSVNLIQGGNALNIIPNVCEFLLELRNLPADHPTQTLQKITEFIEKTLLPKMRKEYKDACVEMVPIFSAPGMETSEDLAITKLVRELTSEKNILKVAYATEGGLFQQASIPTVICGPGNIDQAHRANEFVEVEQIRKCGEFICKVVKHFCSDNS